MSVAFPVMDGAICVDVNPDWFFPPKRGEEMRARHLRKHYCGSCPVYAKCLEWAVTSEDEKGIWAGTTPDQRRRMREGP